MAQQSKLKLCAITIVLLSLLIISPNVFGKESDQLPPYQEVRATLVWGDISNTIASGTGTTVWDGSVKLPGGDMKVVLPLRFKDPKDRLLNLTGSGVSFQSDINSDYDGILLRLFPDQTDTSPMLQVTTQYGGVTNFSLTNLVQKKKLVTDVGGGYQISLHLEDVRYTKGSLKEQFDTELGKVNQVCASATGQLLCQEKSTALKLEYNQKKFSGIEAEKILLRSTSIKNGLHPDALNFFSREELAALTPSDLEKFDFTKLHYLSRALYEKLALVYPNSLALLSEDLRVQADLYEGMLPEALVQKSGIAGPTYALWIQVLVSYPDPLRKELFSKLQTLSAAQLNDLISFSREDLTAFFDKLLVLRQEQFQMMLPLYVEQLKTVHILDAKLDQVQLLLSVKEYGTLKQMLTRLRNTIVFGSKQNPSIFKALDSFLTTLSVVNASDRAAILKNLDQIFTKTVEESTLEKIKAGAFSFKDSNDEGWFAPYVQQVAAMGIVTGYKDKKGSLTGTFGPSDAITKAELLKIALETAGLGTATGSVLHSEAKGHWAEGYVRRAELLHLSLVEKSLFDINGTATRADVIRTLLEVFQLTPPSIISSPFQDVSLNDAASRYIAYAKEKGIISGDDAKNTFRPNESVNRAEVAKMVVHVLELLKKPLDVAEVSGDLTK